MKKTQKKSKFFKSLRFRIMFILFILGIVPSVIVAASIIGTYEERAVSVRISNVKNQCDIISNMLINEGYMSDQSSVSINSKLEMFSSVYSGRVMVVDLDFRVIKDTYNLDEGKTLISEDVIKCYRGEVSTQYNEKSQFIEMAFPIQGEDASKIYGVIYVNVSTNEIASNIELLEQREILILGIIAVLVIVLGYVLSSLLVKPFARVTKAIEDLTDGYQKDEISVPDYTETELITEAFNKMLSRMKVLDE